MNIYKLNELVTPRPWMVDRMMKCGVFIEAGLDEHRSEDGVIASFRQAYPGVTNRANARFVVHCSNNFMKMLAALKEEHAEYINSTRSEMGECAGHGLPGTCKTCKLIAELESVT